MAEPLCPYFGKCGGCSLQRMDYDMQIESKRDSAAKALGIDDVEVFSGKEYGYRSRLDVVFHRNGAGMRMKENSSDVIHIEQCPIANKRINEIISEVNRHFHDADAFDLKRKTGTFCFAVIRAYGDESSISLVLNSKSTRIADAVEKAKQFSAATSAKSVIVGYTSPGMPDSTSEDFFVVKGGEELHESYLGKRFAYPSQGFFQNNHDVAEKMHAYCRGLLQKQSGRATLLDLYAGVGTFGIVNADIFSSVFIVESYAKSIEFAEKNIKENNIKNARAFALDAGQIGRLKISQPLVCLADPPRSGMEMKAIEKLKMFKPKAIVYVSCNLMQLKKDIAKFKGYRLESAAVFDMFPQTNHIEAVAELVLE